MKKIKPLELKGYEALIYAIMKGFEKDGTKSSLENIHFKAVEYVLKYPLKIEGNTDIVKVLKKNRYTKQNHRRVEIKG